ncbi:MAG: hypothetical protein ACTHK7_07280 [Aureliella sp.]
MSDQALLKCPNCGNQFRLGDVLDAFYAPWEILENPGIAASAASAAPTSAAAEPTAAAAAAETAAAQPAGLALEGASEREDRGLSLDGPDLELADDEESGTGISIGGAGEGKPKTDWSEFKPITHEEFQRMKRADRSPIWSTLQVVLGGAAAIPVSLLLIWYVLDKDVAGAGPAVARYVPWIVPQKFRGQAATFEPAEPVAEPRRVPRRGESGFRKFDDVMPLDEKYDAGSSSAAKSDEQPTEGKKTEGQETVVGTLSEKDQQLNAAGNASDANQPEQPAVDAAPPAPADASQAADAPKPADAPMADVFALLKRTKDKVDDWKQVSAADDSAKKDAAISLFEDLASLGAHFSSIPDTPGAPALARDKAQEIARAIKRQPDLAEVLQSADRAQLDGRLPRSKNGWVLVCTVGEFLEQDDSWRMMVADPSLLPLRLPTIEIPKSIAPQLTSGQRLLLLGTFIAPPGTDTTSAENAQDAAPAPEVFRASFSYGL